MIKKENHRFENYICDEIQRQGQEKVSRHATTSFRHRYNEDHPNIFI